MYSVKEIYYTLQGEGAHSGRPAVFCRFSGCNLWTGRESDRHKAVCQFCDTDFVGTDGPGGGQFSNAEALAAAVKAMWPAGSGVSPYVVCTGGEPLLQLDQALVSAFHDSGIVVAVETNGTLLPPPGIDWICMSPKTNAQLRLKSGDELKLVYPQAGAEPDHYAMLDFRHFFLQPMDMMSPEKTNRNILAATDYCLRHPQWRLSLQSHKLIGIP